MLFEAINFKKHVPSHFLTKTTALFVNLAQVDEKEISSFPFQAAGASYFLYSCIVFVVRLDSPVSFFPFFLSFFFSHPPGTWSAYRLLQAFLFFPTYLLLIPSRMDKEELFRAVIWYCGWLETAHRGRLWLETSVQHPNALYSIYQCYLWNCRFPGAAADRPPRAPPSEGSAQQEPAQQGPCPARAPPSKHPGTTNGAGASSPPGRKEPRPASIPMLLNGARTSMPQRQEALPYLCDWDYGAGGWIKQEKP